MSTEKKSTVITSSLIPGQAVRAATLNASAKEFEPQTQDKPKHRNSNKYTNRRRNPNNKKKNNNNNDNNNDDDESKQPAVKQSSNPKIKNHSNEKTNNKNKNKKNKETKEKQQHNKDDTISNNNFTSAKEKRKIT